MRERDDTGSMAPMTFWSAPLSYLHWASRAKPAIFWSFVIGSMGPVMMVRADSDSRAKLSPYAGDEGAKIGPF